MFDLFTLEIGKICSNGLMRVFLDYELKKKLSKQEKRKSKNAMVFGRGKLRTISFIIFEV